MSRKSIALISGAVLVSILTLPMSTARAQSGPTAEDFDALVERLEQAEAEIQELRRRPAGRPAAYYQENEYPPPGERNDDNPPPDDAAQPANPEWLEAYRNLESRFG